MKMSEEFPSKYLKAADLQGREVKVVMQNVEREIIGKDQNDTKPVLYFKGKDKGVVLNKTNAGTISAAYGDDTDDWFDQPLILFSMMVDFQGKTGPAIRCRVPTAKDNKPAPRKPDPISSGPDDFPGDRSNAMPSDEIPF
jgi:arabinogalactan endo-1,4-beta-galactosidase